jgi:hypothetical protein
MRDAAEKSPCPGNLVRMEEFIDQRSVKHALMRAAGTVTDDHGSLTSYQIDTAG